MEVSRVVTEIPANLHLVDFTILSKDMPWSLFPFVAGLIVVIRGVENLGLSEFAATQLPMLDSDPFRQIVATAFGAGPILVRI